MYKVMLRLSAVSCLGWSYEYVAHGRFTSLDAAREAASAYDKGAYMPCASVVQVTPATDVTVFTTYCPTCTL